MIEPKLKPHYVAFDGMSWPIPTERTRDIEHKMRYARDKLTDGDLLLAASVLDAYREMVNCSARKRDVAVNGIRAAMKG
jgi:hypothetical protein